MKKIYKFLNLIALICSINGAKLKSEFDTSELSELDKYKAFGGWAINEELFLFIRNILSDGSKILELGSGWGTSQLVKCYTVYSVEHDKKWLNLYNSHYIFAPIKNGWYDTAILEKKLPKNYDLILIDGPTGAIGRYGFYTNLHLFNTDTIIIFDDIDRPAEYKLMEDVAHKLNRNFNIYGSDNKLFGVIFNK